MAALTYSQERKITVLKSLLSTSISQRICLPYCHSYSCASNFRAIFPSYWLGQGWKLSLFSGFSSLLQFWRHFRGSSWIMIHLKAEKSKTFASISWGKGQNDLWNRFSALLWFYTVLMAAKTKEVRPNFCKKEACKSWANFADLSAKIQGQLSSLFVLKLLLWLRNFRAQFYPAVRAESFLSHFPLEESQ